MAERLAVVLAPCAGEAELSDPAVTGIFASEMASIAAQPHVAPWCGYIARADGRPVGFAGFKGPPDDGQVVEIGYLTFPGSEGRGVATAAAGALVAVAAGHGARGVIAHTLPAENASTSVLRANGFVRDGTAIDPDEGEVWRWLRRL